MRRKLTEEEKEKILSDFKNDKMCTINSLTRKYNCGKKTINNILKDRTNSKDFNKRKWRITSKETKEKILKDLEKTLSTDFLSKKYNKSAPLIRKLKREFLKSKLTNEFKIYLNLINGENIEKTEENKKLIFNEYQKVKNIASFYVKEFLWEDVGEFWMLGDRVSRISERFSCPKFLVKFIIEQTDLEDNPKNLEDLKWKTFSFTTKDIEEKISTSQ